MCLLLLLLCRHHSCVVCDSHVVFWIIFTDCNSIGCVGVCCIGFFLFLLEFHLCICFFFRCFDSQLSAGMVQLHLVSVSVVVIDAQTSLLCCL